jgi:crotonobetainyl-CoA:carnitine CoA-transferase CaiB-like acyl-CoA transferase
MSLFDAAVDFLSEYNIRYIAEGVPPTRSGNRGIFGGCHMYEAKDGNVFIYYLLSWNQLLKAIGREDLKDDPDYIMFNILSNPKVDEMIQDWVRTKTRKEAVEQLNREGVVCAPVQSIDEMLKDPQVSARGLFVDAEHPRIGKMQQQRRLWKHLEIQRRGNRQTPRRRSNLSRNKRGIVRGKVGT